MFGNLIDELDANNKCGDDHVDDMDDEKCDESFFDDSKRRDSFFDDSKRRESKCLESLDRDLRLSEDGIIL